MLDVAAILLAAGQSRRMGAFKPLLPFGDKTVIESCIDYLRAGGAWPIVVVIGNRGEDVRAKLADAPVVFAVNPDPASEMNASIACGISRLPASARATLIALTDQPAIPASVVAALIEEWRSEAKLVKPDFAGHGGHPVLADLSLRAELLSLDPQRGLKALFDAHQTEVSRVSVDSPYIARDMDTWDDYLALHREVFGVEPAALRND